MTSEILLNEVFLVLDYLTGRQVVAGSNPASPTNFFSLLVLGLGDRRPNFFTEI